MTIIIFLIVLAVLIFVHELGHFLVARWCGIRVDAFAIGFGPKIISKKVGETLYSLNLIPFGGYVKIFGENPDDASINGPDKDRSFVHKPKYQQIAVLFSGVFFNFTFAWLLIVIAFSIGVLASTDSYAQYSEQMTNKHIVITYVNPRSPAEKVGLKVGDTIIAPSLADVQKSINESKDGGVNIKYLRDDTEKEVRVVAEEGIVANKYAIGITMAEAGILKLPIYKALWEADKFTWHIIFATFAGLYHLVAGMFDGTASLSLITGPVGIAGLIGDAAKLGFSYLIMFTAIISINLGVLNLIPFPALDGGRILFVLIEAVIRRPIKPAVTNLFNAIGFGLLILLMIVVTYRDIANLFIM